MANRELMITLGADTTSFSKKIKNAKDILKELDNSFNLAASSSKKFEDSLEGIGKKQQYLSDKLEVINSASKEYVRELTKQQEELEKNKREVDKYSNEINKLSKELKEGKISATEYDSAIEKQRQNLEKSERAVQRTVERISKLSREYDDLQTETQKLSRETVVLSEKLKVIGTDNNIDSMKTDIKEVETSFKELKNNVEGYENTLSGITNEQVHYNKQIRATTTLMSEYNKEIRNSKIEVQKYSTELNEVEKELREWEELFLTLKATEPDYSGFANEVEELRKEFSLANAALEFHEERIEKLGNEYRSAEKDLGVFEKSLTSASKKLKELNKTASFDKIENELERVRHEFDLLGSKMELLSSKYLNFENSLSGARRESQLLKQQTAILREEFQQQEQALSMYRNELNTLSEKHSSLTNEIKQTRMSLVGMDRDSPTFQNTIKAISTMENELQDIEGEIKEVTTSLREMELASNSTLTNINNNIVGQHRGWDVLSNKIKNTGDGFISVGQSMQSLGSSLMPVTLGVTALGGAIITTGMNFQEGMDKAKSVMGATNFEVTKMTEKARELAKQSRWTATDVADAYNYMGMAGWDASESMKGIKGVLDLATAGATDLATTSDIVTDGLTAMQLSAKDTTMFVNAMAATMVGSNTDIATMGETLKYAGNVAGGLGITMQDLSLAIGVMANAGIKGSMSGTALRGGLTRLIAPTKEAQVQMKKYGIELKKTEDGNIDLKATMENLRKTIGGLDKDTQSMVAKTIFGQTAMNGWLAVINADSDAFNELAQEINRATEEGSNFAEMLSKEMNDNLAGDLRTLKSTIEETFLTVFEEIEPFLREFVQGLTKGIRLITEEFKGLDYETQQNIIKFVALSAIVAPLLSLFGLMSAGIGYLVKGFGGLVDGTGKVLTKFDLLKENGFKLSSLFPTLSGGASGLSGTLSGGLAGSMGALSSVAIPALVVALGGIITALGDNENALTWLIDKWGWFGTGVAGIMEFLSGICQISIGNIILMVKMLGKALVTLLKGDFKDLDDVFREGWAEIENNSRKAISNIQLESTLAISRMRKLTEKDLGAVKTVFETTFAEIPKTTSKNIDEVANNLARSFADTHGEIINLSDTTLTTLRGTSDTMAILFNRINSEMDISDATEIFKSNLKQLLNSGNTTTEELIKDFEKAGILIDKNLIDGMQRTIQNADEVLSQFDDIVKGNLDEGLNDIVSILDDLGQRGVDSLRNLGTNWRSIFGDIKADGSMTTEEMKDAILKNIEQLGLDTPEKLAEFKNALKYELQIATDEAKAESTETGKAITEGVVEGTKEGEESATQDVKNHTKKIAEGAKEGMKEGLVDLPQSVQEDLAKVGVSINKQGQVIVEDMGKKGGDAGKAYVDTLNQELPSLSNTSKLIQDQLAGIDSVRLGNVTKQLSEINKWLITVQNTALKTRSGLVNLTNLPWGNTTKGLSETNQWLMRTTNRSKDTYKEIVQLTQLKWGNTTKGLSEVNEWLMRTTNRAKDTKNAMQSITNVKFGGVTKGLSEIARWLDTIKGKAQTTKNAITSVANASKASVEEENNTPIPDFGMDMNKFNNRNGVQNIDINKFKTNGGYYSPSTSKNTQTKSNNSNSELQNLLKATLEQNQLLLGLLNKDKVINTIVNVDGRQIAKASARYIESEINSLANKKNRLGGVY